MARSKPARGVLSLRAVAPSSDTVNKVDEEGAGGAERKAFVPPQGFLPSRPVLAAVPSP